MAYVHPAFMNVEQVAIPVVVMEKPYLKVMATGLAFTMHTRSGKEIKFEGFMHVTKDVKVASYLMHEKEQGNSAIISTEWINEEQLDPAFDYKQKVIAEYLAEQKLNVPGARPPEAGTVSPAGMATTLNVTATENQSTVGAIAAAKNQSKVNS